MQQHKGKGTGMNALWRVIILITECGIDSTEQWKVCQVQHTPTLNVVSSQGIVGSLNDQFYDLDELLMPALEAFLCVVILWCGFYKQPDSCRRSFKKGSLTYLKCLANPFTFLTHVSLRRGPLLESTGGVFRSVNEWEWIRLGSVVLLDSLMQRGDH